MAHRPTKCDTREVCGKTRDAASWVGGNGLAPRNCVAGAAAKHFDWVRSVHGNVTGQVLRHKPFTVNVRQHLWGDIRIC